MMLNHEEADAEQKVDLSDVRQIEDPIKQASFFSFFFFKFFFSFSFVNRVLQMSPLSGNPRFDRRRCFPSLDFRSRSWENQGFGWRSSLPSNLIFFVALSHFSTKLSGGGATRIQK